MTKSNAQKYDEPATCWLQVRVPASKKARYQSAAGKGKLSEWVIKALDREVETD